jgi:glyoxylase I family protein
MLKVETIDHVSLPVTDLEDSMRFYEEILGLVKDSSRPSDFDFKGAWYQLGDLNGRKLHLIVHETRMSTFRVGKKLDSHDIHFALRVSDYVAAVNFLLSRGYQPDAKEELKKMKASPRARAGFPQIYIMDPDRNVIELNATAELSEGQLEEVERVIAEAKKVKQE